MAADVTTRRHSSIALFPFQSPPLRQHKSAALSRTRSVAHFPLRSPRRVVKNSTQKRREFVVETALRQLLLSPSLVRVRVCIATIWAMSEPQQYICERM